MSAGLEKVGGGDTRLCQRLARISAGTHVHEPDEHAHALGWYYTLSKQVRVAVATDFPGTDRRDHANLYSNAPSFRNVPSAV